MTFVVDLVETLLKYPELGWVLVLGYLYVELRSPRGRIQRMDERILAITTVVRALSRVHGDVETSEVDKYLVENGQEPDDFLGPGRGTREKVDKSKRDGENPEEKRSVHESVRRPTDDEDGLDPTYKRGLSASEENRL